MATAADPGRPPFRRDQTTPARQAAPGLPGLRMRQPAELDDDGRGGAAAAARERAARLSDVLPIVDEAEDSWPVPCGPSRCHPATRSRCSARAPGASARVRLAAARRLPRCAVVWTSA